MGAIGGIVDAFDNPSVNVVSKVKNKGLQTNIDAALGDYSSIKSAGSNALSDYISKYLGGTQDATARTNQEIGATDSFYNGAAESQLAGLRAQRRQAITDAAGRAQQYALANISRSRLGSAAGPSSYDRQLALKNMTDISTSAAVDDANQSRADWNYVKGNQVALAGQRQNLQDSLYARGLVPEATRRSMYGQDLGYLGTIGNLDQANKFYGLKQDRNQWANFFDAADAGIMNTVATGATAASAAKTAGMSRGGPVRGPGTSTSDNIPIHASPGEFVLPAESMEIPGARDFAEELRAMGLRRRAKRHHARRMAMGGLVQRYADGGRVRGYEDGGMVWSSDVSNPFDSGFDFGNGAGASDSVGFSPGNWQEYGGRQQQQPQQGQTGGGSGITGSAQALMAREGRATSPTWQPATMTDPQMGNFIIPRSMTPTTTEFYRPQGLAQQAPDPELVDPERWTQLTGRAHPDDVDRALFDPDYYLKN